MGWVRALGALVASANFVNCFVSLSFFFLFFFLMFSAVRVVSFLSSSNGITFSCNLQAIVRAVKDGWHDLPLTSYGISNAIDYQQVCGI